jgi:7,8-dihydroneopterin aldolase/epimerase/oxygenase
MARAAAGRFVMGATVLPSLGERCVVVDDLRLNLLIGVHDYEWKARQEVSITIHMFVADAGPTRSDDLADHVSYADIVAALKERAESTRHTQLIETLAEEVVELAFADARVRRVIVDVRKTEIIPETRSVGVILHRQRPPAGGAG